MADEPEVTQEPSVEIAPTSNSEADVAAAKVANEVLKTILAGAPSVHDILARPFLYDEWLKKAQEALNG